MRVGNKRQKAEWEEDRLTLSEMNPGALVLILLTPVYIQFPAECSVELWLGGRRMPLPGVTLAPKTDSIMRRTVLSSSLLFPLIQEIRKSKHILLANRITCAVTNH